MPYSAGVQHSAGVTVLFSNWFKDLTGFRETSYAGTKAQLAVEGQVMRSLANGKSFGIGELETPSLAELRERTVARPGRLRLRNVIGEAGSLHADPANAGALFQVASQFNLLEMPGPTVTPERGVTGYASDRTQGPACAIAAGAAAIYRNYFAPCRGGFGQTSDRQIDCLEDIGEVLGNGTQELWDMRNGYAMVKDLPRINQAIEKLGSEDELRDRLRIGLQWEVEVTSAPEPHQRVSQAFCSALPIGYLSGVGPDQDWHRFAQLVLDGTYEATLWGAVLNAERTGSNVVFLTLVGGGVFGNRIPWIITAIRRALQAVGDVDLDVRIVNYRTVDAELGAFVSSF